MGLSFLVLFSVNAYAIFQRYPACQIPIPYERQLFFVPGARYIANLVKRANQTARFSIEDHNVCFMCAVVMR